MTKRSFVATALFFFGAPLTVLAAPKGTTKTWKGYITDTYCGFNRVNEPPTASCTTKCVQEQHAKYAFFNFADKKVYVLNPQDEAAKYAGQTVTVAGTVSGLEKFATRKRQSSGAIITASAITPEPNK